MKSAIIVDGGKMTEMPITFDIVFPHLPCYMLSLDVMDETGEHIRDFDHDVYKNRLDPQGREIETERSKDLSNKSIKNAEKHGLDVPENYCGPCYGVKGAGECCNTCSDVTDAYSEAGWDAKMDDFEQCIREGWKEKAEQQAKEGCRMYGTIDVKKLRGNFHFSSGRPFKKGGSHIHDMAKFFHNEESQNFKHHILSLQFGKHDYQQQMQKRTKVNALIHPLRDTTWGGDQATLMYQYFIKIVPTQFNFLSGKPAETYQYSVSKQGHAVSYFNGLPGVFFMLDHSPMRIVYTETKVSLASYLTSVCAIIGGIFTVASVVDGILYRANRISVQRKGM